MKKLIIVLGAVAVLMLGVLVIFKLSNDKRESLVEVKDIPTMTPPVEVMATHTLTPTQEPIKTVEPTNTTKETDKPKITPTPTVTQKPIQAHTNTEKPSTNATPKASLKPVATPKLTAKPTSTPKPTVAPTPKHTKKPTDDMQLDLGREMIEKAGFWTIVQLPNGNYGMLVPNSSYEYSDKAIQMLNDYFDDRECDIDITALHGGNWGDGTGRYYYEFNKRGIYPR